MARRTKEEAERTRTRIMASALSLFARKGYDRTTFNDIAARLKLTKGAVYWHFESKEALLLALIDQMLARFQRIIEDRMPARELSFPVVADVMANIAQVVVSEAKASAFFMLMHTQVRWGDASMAQVRESLLVNARFGPMQAFRTALENDRCAGRVRADIAVEEIASTCIALWDGLVQSRIDGFLQCGLGETIRHAYESIWSAIKVLKHTRKR